MKMCERSLKPSWILCRKESLILEASVYQEMESSKFVYFGNQRENRNLSGNRKQIVEDHGRKSSSIILPQRKESLSIKASPPARNPPDPLHFSGLQSLCFSPSSTGPRGL